MIFLSSCFFPLNCIQSRRVFRGKFVVCFPIVTPETQKFEWQKVFSHRNQKASFLCCLRRKLFCLIFLLVYHFSLFWVFSLSLSLFCAFTHYLSLLFITDRARWIRDKKAVMIRKFSKLFLKSSLCSHFSLIQNYGKRLTMTNFFFAVLQNQNRETNRTKPARSATINSSDAIIL